MLQVLGELLVPVHVALHIEAFVEHEVQVAVLGMAKDNRIVVGVFREEPGKPRQVSPSTSTGTATSSSNWLVPAGRAPAMTEYRALRTFPRAARSERTVVRLTGRSRGSALRIGAAERRCGLFALMDASTASLWGPVYQGRVNG